MSITFITNDEEFVNKHMDNDEVDDIDYGIEQQNFAIIYDEDKPLLDNEIINPFFVGINGGNLKSISWGDIHRNYNSVIIITLSSINNNYKLDKLFKYTIKRDELKEISNVTFFRTGLNILHNKDHFYKTNIVSKSDLNELFPTSNFNQSELVLSIFEMDEENTRKYCNMYKSVNDINDISNKIDIYKYYLGDKKNINNLNLSNIFKNLKDNEYWTNVNNLQINMTHTFVDREFNNQRTTKNSHFKVVSIRKENEVNYKTIKKGSSEYPIGEQSDKSIEKQYISIKSNFVDPSAVIRKGKNGKKRTFYSSSNNQLSYEYMTEIFDNLTNEKLKYDLLNNCIASKDYCHLILNNKQILEQSKSIFSKYPHVFKYTIGYAWLTFYLEECLARSKTQKHNRFVFDIHTASNLPVFPYVYTDIKQNPYITILTDDIEISQQNTFGLSFKEDYDGYGVADLDTFKKRFNMFTSGNPDINPLTGLDWSKFAVSGSTIPACLQKRSLLLDAHVKLCNGDETEGFKQFVKKYYGSSDIDLMSNETNILEFLQSVNNVNNLLKTNLNANDKDMKYDIVKNFAISITKYFFEDYLNDFNTTYGFNKTIDEFKKMSDDMIFKLYLYQKYIEVKNTITKKLISTENIKNKFVNEYFIPNNYENMNIYIVDSDNYDNYHLQDNEVIYYRNDFGKNLSQKENKMVIKFSENVRFKLFCKDTKIEMFRIKDKDFFGTVARFHFPCVRAYYQGDNVFMLPSCITAMMTGLNIEYKYFAGIRNPIDIIDKYLERAFGVLLNKFEINLMIEYNKNLDDTNPLKYKSESDKDILFGKKNIKNRIYNIENNNLELGKLIENNDDLQKYYQTFQKNSCVNCLKMTTINKNGDINKYQPSYVQLCYDEMN
jgi:hypothetical protein